MVVVVVVEEMVIKCVKVCGLIMDFVEVYDLIDYG